jgi:hypothetical protein
MVRAAASPDAPSSEPAAAVTLPQTTTLVSVPPVGAEVVAKPTDAMAAAAPAGPELPLADTLPPRAGPASASLVDSLLVPLRASGDTRLVGGDVVEVADPFSFRHKYASFVRAGPARLQVHASACPLRRPPSPLRAYRDSPWSLHRVWRRWSWTLTGP